MTFVFLDVIDKHPLDNFNFGKCSFELCFQESMVFAFLVSMKLKSIEQLS